MAFGAALLVGGLFGQEGQVVAAEPHAGTSLPAGDGPIDASTSVAYRWDFEHFPSH